jgi:hypothetical protein
VRPDDSVRKRSAARPARVFTTRPFQLIRTLSRVSWCVKGALEELAAAIDRHARTVAKGGPSRVRIDHAQSLQLM